MKIITLSKIGYNHPSQANWSYEIFKIDTIDTNTEYNMSYTIKEAFTSDSQLARQLSEAIAFPVYVSKAVYTSTGTPKITGVAKMPSGTDKELINTLKDFLKA
jgi:hypothetical protein